MVVGSGTGLRSISAPLVGSLHITTFAFTLVSQFEAAAVANVQVCVTLCTGLKFRELGIRVGQVQPVKNDGRSRSTAFIGLSGRFIFLSFPGLIADSILSRHPASPFRLP
jgi:hypothetical protein